MLVGGLASHGAVDLSRRVVTLGPAGTDAEAEARQHFRNVDLVDSFATAMEHAEKMGSYALVPAGYLKYHGDSLADTWVDLHFRWNRRMQLAAVWENSTRTMCFVYSSDRVAALNEVRSIALHPATRTLAESVAPHARLRFVDAKPLALRAVLDCQVDACICSLDMVPKSDSLRVETVFNPTMLWCLYDSVPPQNSCDIVAADPIRS